MTWHVYWQINPDWPESIQYVIISIFIKKNLILNIYFKLNYIFINHLVIFWPIKITISQSLCIWGKNVSARKKYWQCIFFNIKKKLNPRTKWSSIYHCKIIFNQSFSPRSYLSVFNQSAGHLCRWRPGIGFVLRLQN
jgi:hypothetical protein